MGALAAGGAAPALAGGDGAGTGPGTGGDATSGFGVLLQRTFRSPVTAGLYRIVVAWCGDPACGTGIEAGTVQAVLERP